MLQKKKKKLWASLGNVNSDFSLGVLRQTKYLKNVISF